jgi:23S rRNA pseudouridine1911/1915/1917 synthase
MAQKYTVSKQIKLLPFLFEVLDGWSKKTVKQYLKGSSILVNGKAETQHDYSLSQGDEVEVVAVRHARRTAIKQRSELDIIYQDKDLIAINKPAGLLSVATTIENKNHALAMLRTQLSHKKKGIKLWPVNRLDRETSGIMLFATSKEMREAVMDHWDDAQKVYLAIVDSIPDAESSTITQPLRQDKEEYRMHTGEHPDAKPATTRYKTIESRNGKALLEVQIDTGRQHQIRAHLAWLGHSVIGDERYGIKGKRMGLHATRLSFMHPISEKRISLEVPPPRDFYELL